MSNTRTISATSSSKNNATTPDIRQPTEDVNSAWACSTRDDAAARKATEDIMSYTQYLSESLSHYLDDEYPREGHEETLMTMMTSIQ